MLGHGDADFGIEVVPTDQLVAYGPQNGLEDNIIELQCGGRVQLDDTSMLYVNQDCCAVTTHRR